MMLNFITLNDYNIAESFLKQLKSFLRISHNDDDEILKILFRSCVNFSYNKTEILIGKRDFQLSLRLNYNEFNLFEKTKRPFTVTAIKVDNINRYFTIQNGIIKIDGENVNNQIVEIFFTTENNFFPPELIITIFRHVFFLYENRGIISDNTNCSFYNHEIEKLYQPFIQNNFNI